MSKTAAVVGGLILASAAYSIDANAQGVSVQVGPGGVGVNVGDGPRRGHRGHRGRHYGWGPGFYFYDGHYHGDCSWMRQRAKRTGSSVWWRRYRQCRNS
ncbi:MAG: hypothetical protein R3D67_08120 [Hyphomicrobiaceae bacterium]